MSPTSYRGAVTIHDATFMLPYSERAFSMATQDADDFWRVFNMPPTVINLSCRQHARVIFFSA